MEIGSIYEMNPNCIEKAGSLEKETFGRKEVKKHGRENTVYTASAREAISLVLHSLEKGVKTGFGSVMLEALTLSE